MKRFKNYIYMLLLVYCGIRREPKFKPSKGPPNISVDMSDMYEQLFILSEISSRNFELPAFWKPPEADF